MSFVPDEVQRAESHLTRVALELIRKRDEVRVLEAQHRRALETLRRAKDNWPDIYAI